MFEKEGIKYTLEEIVGTECLYMPIEYLHFIDLAESQQEKAQCFKDGAEFGYNKAKEEMQEQGLALQSDMDKTIEQNIQLKKQIEKMKNVLQRWYNQHSDKTYTKTFYDELIKATEEFLWSDVCEK